MTRALKTRLTGPCDLALLIVLALLLAGCNAVRRPIIPIGTVVHPPAVPSESGPLVVLLPGFFDRPEAFEREGLVEVIRDARPDAEIVAADAYIGYYRRGAIRQRIEEDILAPARKRGRDEIWFVGTSLGGAGTLLLGEQQRSAIAGIVLLAPYVGPGDLLDHVDAAGSIEGYEPGGERERVFRDAWGWLMDRNGEASPTKVFLGYGRDDRGADDHARFAEHVKPDAVAVLDGGHDWPVWRDALAALVERGALR